jgi:hypothetical protein
MVACTQPPRPPVPPQLPPHGVGVVAPLAPLAVIVTRRTPAGTLKICDAPVYLNVRECVEFGTEAPLKPGTPPVFSLVAHAGRSTTTKATKKTSIYGSDS